MIMQKGEFLLGLLNFEILDDLKTVLVESIAFESAGINKEEIKTLDTSASLASHRKF